VELVDSRFRGFVNFFDCQYDGPLVVRRCHFDGGTNLLGNVGQPFVVGFAVPPIVEDTTGDLLRDGG
jgi:hypothetical protein